MSSVLDKLKRGGQDLPPRVILSGPEGIGKTTWGASAPEPLFIASENGLTGMDHVTHIEPSSFKEVLDLIDELIAAKEIQYKTIVIDTVDWLERSIYQFICKRDGKEGIEDYGYGKGFTIGREELVKLLAKLDCLRYSKRVGIIILSHVQIVKFNDPTGTSWERYTMKGNDKFTGILREWPDACLFAARDLFKTKERGELREKVIGGDHIIHTEWSVAWDAKNRYELPPTLPMPKEGGYSIFAAAVEANSPTTLRKRALALMSSAVFDSEAQKAAWEKVKWETLPPEKLREAIIKLEAKQPKAA